jgi:aromatic-L-amino-acid decarboxylase
MIEQEKFREKAKLVVDWIDSYFQKIESFPVKSNIKPGEVFNKIPDFPPDKSEHIEAVLTDLDQIILPGITHWQHPNFHAYFPANSSYESLLAEMITAALGAQCMLWETSPAATELEERMMVWLRELIGLPGSYEGVIQDSASSATLVAILTAREVATNFLSNRKGTPGNLRVYSSTEVHSSIEKAVKVAGIGSDNLVKIQVDEKMTLVPSELEKQVILDINNGYKPICVVAALGTTGTLAIDPIRPIAEICKRHSIWLHVDAAYAGSALILPEYRWMIDGIEDANSFVFNPHKWLFTNFDCSAYFIKDAEALRRSFEIIPEYLRSDVRSHVNNYSDWGIPMGRRFRALKLWFVLRSFGTTALQEKIRNHLRLMKYFVGNVKNAPDFHLILPEFLNLACFQYCPRGISDQQELNHINKLLLEKINQSGKIYLSHTKVFGNFVLRIVIGQTYVQKRHVDFAWDTIQSIARNISI